MGLKRRVEFRLRGWRDSLILTGPARQGGGVLVVRLDGVGDFVLWLDAARALRRLYPGQRMTLLANAAWSELAERLPYWDEVWPVDAGRTAADNRWRRALLGEIARRGFDIALHPVSSRTLLSDQAMLASRARQRIGVAGDCCNIPPWQKRITDRWYTRLLPPAPQPSMELESNARWLAQLGLADHRMALPRLPPLQPLPQELLPRGRYIVVAPGGGWHEKLWPAERFAALAKAVAAAAGASLVLCGCPGEEPLCAAVAAQAGAPLLNLAGRTSLPQLVELIRGAALLLANDSSAAHIAAAVDTPALAILGGGHFGRFLPYPDDLAGLKPIALYRPMACYNCRWCCTQPKEGGAPYPCITAVTVDDALPLALKLLQERRPAPAAQQQAGA